jgi:glucose-6-phosphate 1-dehydrogenase
MSGDKVDTAVASLKLNNMDPGTPAAKRMLDLLHYVDGDLGDPATYQAMSDTLGQSVQRVLFYLEAPPPLFARIAEGISTVGRAAGNRVMVEKPFGNGLASARKLNDTMHQFFPEDAICTVRPDHHGRGLRRRGPRQPLRQDRRDRLPQLEVLYRPPSADTHADAVSGIATTP